MDRYTVKVTGRAQAQLAEIARYIAYTLQAPDTALRLLDTLEKEIASLSTFPARMPLTEERPWSGLGIHILDAACSTT